MSTSRQDSRRNTEAAVCTAALGAGNPWLGSLDAATGATAPIPGVTEFFSNCLTIHGNFVPTAPGEGLGYARLNETSGPYAVAVVLPAGEQPGSVKKLTKVTDADWSPAWSMSDGAGGVVAASAGPRHQSARRRGLRPGQHGAKPA